ncbi:MAG: ABC transporter permease, partial [Aurantimicrobium sp.]
MFGYIIRRILQAIPVFFGTTLLIYFMVFAMPGDPIVALFGDHGVN